IEAVDAVPVFADLARRYGEPHRAYHNLAHLRQVLDHVQQQSGTLREPAAVELAAWFHDVVYDPRANDNEEQSAARAANVLANLGMDAELIRRVSELILLTKTHAAPPGDTDALVLLDADLAILGAPPDEYERYAGGIRQEYAHVSDEDFRQGRIAVL